METSFFLEQSVPIVIGEILVSLLFLVSTFVLQKRITDREDSKLKRNFEGFIRFAVLLCVMNSCNLMRIVFSQCGSLGCDMELRLVEYCLVSTYLLVSILDYTKLINFSRQNIDRCFIAYMLVFIVGNLLLSLFPKQFLAKILIVFMILCIFLSHLSVLIHFRKSCFAQIFRNIRSDKLGFTYYCIVLLMVYFIPICYFVIGNYLAVFIVSVLLFWVIFIFVLWSCVDSKSLARVRIYANRELFVLPSLNATLLTLDGSCSDITTRLFDYFESEKPYLSKDFSIIEASLALFTNKTYLSRNLNMFVGKSFRDFVNYYRVKEAMLIFIKDDDIPVTELCNLCGFRNNASFINAFKRHSGFLPSEWCKSIRNILEEDKVKKKDKIQSK